jgi:hypothetical protein
MNPPAIAYRPHGTKISASENNGVDTISLSKPFYASLSRKYQGTLDFFGRLKSILKEFLPQVKKKLSDERQKSRFPSRKTAFFSIDSLRALAGIRPW